MSVRQAKRLVWQMWLKWYLRLIGATALLAFAAALMPAAWFIDVSARLGLEFADNPLTFYLARNLSLLYGFVGCLLLLVAADLPRYLPLTRWAAWGTILFGGLQWIVDSQSQLPAWWTLGESLSTVVGGLILGWLAKKATPP